MGLVSEVYMTKKEQRKIRDRMYRALKYAAVEKGKRIEAEDKAEYYKNRFKQFGNNVKTVEPDSGKLVVCEKWEIKPQDYGHYACITDLSEVQEEMIIKELAQSIAKSLLENDLVQFISNRNCLADGPIKPGGTVAAKLYVVPWEMMPHDRRNKIELFKYVENTLENEP